MVKMTVYPLPADQMRYPTAGDWAFTGLGNLEITVAETGNDYYDFLVGLHEAVEAMLCRRAGIPDEAVTAWDLDHLDGRYEEPGRLEGCPYRTQHLYAEAVERAVAAMIGVDWDEYEEAVDAVQHKMGSDLGGKPGQGQPALNVG